MSRENAPDKSVGPTIIILRTHERTRGRVRSKDMLTTKWSARTGKKLRQLKSAISIFILA